MSGQPKLDAIFFEVNKDWLGEQPTEGAMQRAIIGPASVISQLVAGCVDVDPLALRDVFMRGQIIRPQPFRPVEPEHTSIFGKVFVHLADGNGVSGLKLKEEGLGELEEGLTELFPQSQILTVSSIRKWEPKSPAPAPAVSATPAGVVDRSHNFDDDIPF